MGGRSVEVRTVATRDGTIVISLLVFTEVLECVFCVVEDQSSVGKILNKNE